VDNDNKSQLVPKNKTTERWDVSNQAKPVMCPGDRGIGKEGSLIRSDTCIEETIELHYWLRRLILEEILETVYE
jgi:hypothetical protein